MGEMFAELRKDIEMQVDNWSTKLVDLSFEVISDRRNSQNRTIRQILGHLVDSAVNNHHRIVRLQYTDNLLFPDYRQDNDRWIAIQKLLSFLNMKSAIQNPKSCLNGVFVQALVRS